MTISERHAMEHELEYIYRSLAYTAGRSDAEGIQKPSDEVLDVRARAAELKRILAAPEVSNPAKSYPAESRRFQPQDGK